MKARVFTVRLDPTSGVFDDSELAAFFQAHDAQTITEHPFVFAGVPTIAVVVRYAGAHSPSTGKRPAAPSPELTLSDADRVLYESLRSWRNQRAKKDGRPAYVLFTNQQLAEVARKRPTTIAALTAIDGIGDARIKGYGPDVLKLVAAVPQGATTDDDTPDGGG